MTENIKPKSDFKVLTDRQAILLTAGMYIGSTALETKYHLINNELHKLTYVPAVLKIINEILDNSVDESIRTNFTKSNQISITTTDQTITISDNGGGLPLHDVTLENGKSVIVPVAAWTMKNAGSNFKKERVTIGTHGMGSALTNFFSKSFTGKTSNGTKTCVVACKDGELESVNVFNMKSPSGTTVTFQPDFTHFECDSISDDILIALSDRLSSLALCFPEITFKLNGKSFNTKEIMGNLLSGNNVSIKDSKFTLVINKSNSEEFYQKTFVNGVHTINGGNHVNYIIDGICDELISAIQKKHKITITKARIKEGLSLTLIMRDFVNPRFDSQTKERLSSPLGEIKEYFSKLNFKKIASSILDNEEIINPIISTALDKLEQKSNKDIQQLVNKAKTVRIASHISALKKKDSILFLAEGESAAGSTFLAVRDKNKHGCYHLRGKVMNTYGMSKSDMMKNTELFEICSILGLNVTKPNDISNMTYDKIGILVDADLDGVGSIMPALLCFFYQWKQLFIEKRIMFVRSPVYIVEDKKDQQIWFYDKESFNNSKYVNSKNVRYIKGLGSLRNHEYKRMLNELVCDVITIDSDADVVFNMLYGDDSQLRKDWMSS